MLSNQIFWGSILITGCVVFHVVALLFLTKILKTLDHLIAKILDRFVVVKNLFLLVFAVMYVIFIHTLEMLFWAITYVEIGEFENIIDALYFSIITATTLGYGDIVLSEQARLLSGFEAIGGLILFSVSTAFFIKMISVLFETESEN